MELECKILKEKVHEDEKRSGIGSLFDDDKSSYMHMHLLKVKYVKMKKDFRRQMDDLMKQRLMVFGLMQTLEAQLKSHKDHN